MNEIGNYTYIDLLIARNLTFKKFMYYNIFPLDANDFNKLLSSIKMGKSIERNAGSQFDDRTEESSAVQYFQVFN